MTLDYKGKIQEAQRWLLLKAQVLWATIMVLEKVEDPSFFDAYAWTDGRKLGYNPILVMGIPLDELTFVLAHEAMHIRLRHHLRMGDRDLRIWNDAGDYVINLILKDLGFNLPGDVLCDMKYRGWTTERVYDDLRRQQQQKAQQQQQTSSSGSGESESQAGDEPSDEKADDETQDDSPPPDGDSSNEGTDDADGEDSGDQSGQATNGSGDGSSEGDSQKDASASGGSQAGPSQGGNSQPGTNEAPQDPLGSSGNAPQENGELDQTEKPLKPATGQVRELQGEPEELEENENLLKIVEIQADSMQKNCGNEAGNLQRLVEGQTRPVIPWREAILQFLTEWVTSGYDWNRRSRRWSHLEYFLPDNRSKDIGFIPCIMDTSCSIGNAEITLFATEVRTFLEQFDKELLLIYVDAAFQGHQVLESEDDVISPKGGGGTDFRPGFVWLEKEGHSPDALIYLTDGYCNSFPPDPGFPALWVIAPNGTPTFEPPFGEVLYIKDWQ